MRKRGHNRTLGTTQMPEKFSQPDKKDINQYQNVCVDCGKSLRVISPIDVEHEKQEINVQCCDCYDKARKEGWIEIRDHGKERAKKRAEERKARNK